MSSQKHIQDELNNLESGLPFNNNHPFSVPEGYFEGLAAAVLAKVKSSEASVTDELMEISPLLAGIPKVTPYSVPSFYFQENMDAASFITADGNSAILASIGKELPYSVPQGYFKSLPGQIVTKVSLPKAKVVPLFARTWMRVASAAVVAGAIFFAGSQLLSKNNDVPNNTATNNQPDTSQTLIANNQPAIKKQIQQASTKELEAFIETVQVNTKSTGKQANTSTNEAKELLKDVSINEMENFLSDLPVMDDALLTN